MQSIKDTTPSAYVPWNKGKLTGQKPPLQPKHVWAIRTRLQLAEAKRDLVLFNLAIDSKLRGCDLVSLRVEDVAPHGYAIDERLFVRGRPAVPFASNSPNKLAKRSTTTLLRFRRGPESTCSQVGLMGAA